MVLTAVAAYGTRPGRAIAKELGSANLDRSLKDPLDLVTEISEEIAGHRHLGLKLGG
jgi:hypothetical protein